MKKKTILLTSPFIILIAVYFLNFSKPINLPQDYGASACTAPSQWFPHYKTPPPAEGAGSSFTNAATTSNCDFHQWAWQKFLYLTQPVNKNKVLNFMNYLQVDNEMNVLGDTIILDDTTQAGSHSALYDKKNKSVFYSIFVNKQMFDFSNRYLNLFVSKCKTNDTTINQSKLGALGFDTITYPVGSTEIKTSWILASSVDPTDLKKYYVTQGKHKVTGKLMNIALLGMHIITRVQNHPEFIWATFEHDSLAPYAQWPLNYRNDSTPNPNQILSSKNMVFYNAGSRLSDCSVRPYSAKKPNPPVNTFRSTYHLYRNGTQPQYAGMILRSQDSVNQLNIQSINTSVFTRLALEQSPWKNYHYVGAVWIDPVVSKLQPGDGNIGALDRKNLRGSRANTNISMETFAQLNWSYPNLSPPPVETGNTTPGNTMNCFGCHGTANFQINGNTGANYNLALSHLFNNRLSMLLKKQTK